VRAFHRRDLRALIQLDRRGVDCRNRRRDVEHTDLAKEQVAEDDRDADDEQ